MRSAHPPARLRGDVFQIIPSCRCITDSQVRLRRARVKQHRGGRDKSKRGERLIEFERAPVRLRPFAQCESHGQAHPKVLGGFEEPPVVPQQKIGG